MNIVQEMNKCYRRALKRGKITNNDIIGLNFEKIIEALESELNEVKVAWNNGDIQTDIRNGKPEGLKIELLHLQNVIWTGLVFLETEFKKEYKIMKDYELTRDD